LNKDERQTRHLLAAFKND